MSYTTGASEVVRSEASPAGAYWITKTLKFNKTPLKEVRPILVDIFKQDISFANDDLQNCKLTATFEDNTFKEITDVIAATFGIEVITENNRIIFDGDSCN